MFVTLSKMLHRCGHVAVWALSQPPPLLEQCSAAQIALVAIDSELHDLLYERSEPFKTSGRCVSSNAEADLSCCVWGVVTCAATVGHAIDRYYRYNMLRYRRVRACHLPAARQNCDVHQEQMMSQPSDALAMLHVCKCIDLCYASCDERSAATPALRPH